MIIDRANRRRFYRPRDPKFAYGLDTSIWASILNDEGRWRRPLIKSTAMNGLRRSLPVFAPKVQAKKPEHTQQGLKVRFDGAFRSPET